MTTLQLLKVDCSGIKKIIHNSLPIVMVSMAINRPLDLFAEELIRIVKNLPKEEVIFVALYTVIIIFHCYLLKN